MRSSKSYNHLSSFSLYNYQRSRHHIHHNHHLIYFMLSGFGYHMVHLLLLLLLFLVSISSTTRRDGSLFGSLWTRLILSITSCSKSTFFTARVPTTRIVDDVVWSVERWPCNKVDTSFCNGIKSDSCQSSRKSQEVRRMSNVVRQSGDKKSGKHDNDTE